MTREEANSVVKEERELDSSSGWTYNINEEVVYNIIESIYGDFESMTCENCKYFIDEKSTKLQFCNAKTEGGIIGWNGYGKDFGCNKFERKTDV